MSRSTTLAKNTAILTIGKLCTQSISFFLLPLYTAVLSKAEYGTFDLICTYCTLLLPVVGAQYDQGLFRFMIDYRDDKESQSILLSTILFASGVHFCIFLGLVFILTRLIPIAYGSYLILTVGLYIISNLLLQFTRGLGNMKIYAVSSFISAIATIVLNILFLVIFHMGVLGLLLSTALAQCITIVYLFISMGVWRYISVNAVDKYMYHQVKKYALPLIPNSLSWWVVSVSDRIVVSNFLGVAANGIYTVSNKFPNVFMSFYNIFILSWTENVTVNFEDHDREIFLSKLMTQMYCLFSSACLGIIAIIPFVFSHLVNENYQEAYSQIPILMCAMFFRVLVGLYSAIYVAQKKSVKVMKTSVYAAIINLVLNMILIGNFGLYAASFSTLIAFSVMFFVRYFDITKEFKIKIEFRIILPSVALFIILVTTYYWDNKIGNLVALMLVITYSAVINWELLIIAIKLIRKNYYKRECS